MDIRAAVIAQIERFLRGRDMSESTFGLKAVNDGKFVKRLREGGNVTVDRIERAQAFMRANTTKPKRKAA